MIKHQKKENLVKFTDRTIQSLTIPCMRKVRIGEIDQPFILLNANRTRLSDYKRNIVRENYPFYTFELVEEGKGVVEIDNVAYEVKAGDVYFLPALHTHHLYTFHDTPWIKSYFVTYGKLVENLLASYGLSAAFHFPGCDREVVLPIYSEMIELFQANAPDLNEKGALLTHRLISLLAQQRLRAPRFSIPVLEIKYYIDRNLYQHFRLKDISKALGISVRHIIHLFKTETGQTPYDYLIEKRIRLSENLLANPAMTISEIAALLNFTDQYHFSRIFKARNGIAPSVYRKKLVPKS